MTMTVKRTRHGVYMLGDLLEKQGYAPIVNHLPPLWQLRDVTPALNSILKAVHIPAVNWARSEADLIEGTSLISLDSNAGYLTAASSAMFGHDNLSHTGAYDPPERGQIPPGLYLIHVHPWTMGAPGSPLAGAQIGSKVWVTHQTLDVLRCLTYDASWTPGGHWPECSAYDSWTCQIARRFTKWTDAVRDLRTGCIERRESTEPVKLGYSQAIQMWNKPPGKDKRNMAWRPDWYATVLSQHAANMWRRAYQCALLRRPPVQMGGSGHAKDGYVFTEIDLDVLLRTEKSPIRLDETGISLGTFKRLPGRRYAGIEDL